MIRSFLLRSASSWAGSTAGFWASGSVSGTPAAPGAGVACLNPPASLGWPSTVGVSEVAGDLGVLRLALDELVQVRVDPVVHLREGVDLDVEAGELVRDVLDRVLAAEDALADDLLDLERVGLELDRLAEVLLLVREVLHEVA